MDQQLIDLLCAASGMEPTASHPEPAEGFLGWAVDAYDVYVEGREVREARVLVELRGEAASKEVCGGDPASHHRLLLVDALAFPLLIEPELGRALPFDAESLQWAPDGDSASTPAAAFAPSSDQPRTVGRVTDLGAGQLVVTAVTGSAASTVVLTPHRGRVGALTPEELWSQEAGWRRLAECHEPAPEVVEALATVQGPVHLRIALGTWCHLSKVHIPRLLKAVEKAANPRISLELIAVSRDFREPRQAVLDCALINVPTVIVEVGGQERGRITETPATGSMEADVAALLAGRPLRHRGRWLRGALLAWGRYEIRDDQGRQLGDERWAVHRLPAGDGVLLHTEAENRKVRSETFLRVASDGRPTLVELTRHSSQGTSRGRYVVDGARLVAWWRGQATGMLRQELTVPAKFSFANLGAAAVIWQWEQARSAQGGAEAVRYGTSYLDPGGPHTRPGVLVDGRWEWIPGLRSVRGPAGLVSCRHLVSRIGGITSHWWIEPQNRVPVSGRAPGKNWNLVEMHQADVEKLAAHG